MNIEKARAIRSSNHWDDVLKELDIWTSIELQKMRNCSSDQLVVIQTTIKAFEKVKLLPDIVIGRDSDD